MHFWGCSNRCRNSWGKWTCALLSRMSETACLYCWMPPTLRRLLTLTVILRLISLDVAGIMSTSFIQSLMDMEEINFAICAGKQCRMVFRR